MLSIAFIADNCVTFNPAFILAISPKAIIQIPYLFKSPTVSLKPFTLTGIDF